MPKVKRVSFLPLVALTLAMMALPAGASFAKHLFPLLGAGGTAAVRVTFAAIIVSLILRPWRLRLNARGWRLMLVYGLSLGIMNFSFYKSIESIPLGIAVAIEFTGPLAVAVFYSRKLVDFIWIGVAALGILALLPLGQASTSFDLAGYIYILIAASAWAIYIVFGQRASEVGGTPTVALGMSIAAFAILPLGIYQSPVILSTYDWIPMGIGLAILSSAIPYGLEIYALQRLPVKVFGIFLSLEPAFAVFFGFVLLSESLSGLQLLGIFAVVSASAGIAYGARSKTS